MTNLLRAALAVDLAVTTNGLEGLNLRYALDGRPITADALRGKVRAAGGTVPGDEFMAKAKERAVRREAKVLARYGLTVDGGKAVPIAPTPTNTVAPTVADMLAALLAAVAAKG